jgi:oligoribonuclease (3'-5' exoribonuclease)
VIATRITDATAFLEFLKESLAADLNRRDEFLSQLNNITQLLHELSCLVADF